MNKKVATIGGLILTAVVFFFVGMLVYKPTTKEKLASYLKPGATVTGAADSKGKIV